MKKKKEQDEKRRESALRLRLWEFPCPTDLAFCLTARNSNSVAVDVDGLVRGEHRK